MPGQNEDIVEDDDALWEEALAEAAEDDPAVIRSKEEPKKPEKFADEDDEDTVDEVVKPAVKPVVPPVVPEVKAPDTTNPNYAGKTPQELLDMVENGSRMISQQGSKIRQLEEQIKAIQELKDSAKDKEIEDEILSRYDKEDVEAIEKIIERKLTNSEKSNVGKDTTQVNEVQRKANETANEQLWQALNIGANKAIADELDPILRKEIQADPENTLFKKDWVRNRFTEHMKTKEAKVVVPTTDLTNKEKNDNIIKRKISSSTVPSGSGGSQVPTVNFKGTPEPDDPDEYVEWLKANEGVEI